MSKTPRLKDTRIRRAIFGSFLLAASSQMAHAQVEPKSPIHITINGVFFLCPHLVQQGTAPSTADLAKMGFERTTGQDPAQQWFKGSRDKGIILASYDPAKKRCIVNYVGGGYKLVAGAVRDTVTQNKFTRITGGDKGGAIADVFEGPVPNRDATARIVIVENYTNPSASISYAER